MGSVHPPLRKRGEILLVTWAGIVRTLARNDNNITTVAAPRSPPAYGPGGGGKGLRLEPNGLRHRVETKPSPSTTLWRNPKRSGVLGHPPHAKLLAVYAEPETTDTPSLKRVTVAV